MTKHAECSPSQLERIILCPGSRRLKRQCEEEQSSKYAEEGTLLHKVVEMKINSIFGIPELIEEQEHVTNECVKYYDTLVRELGLITQIRGIYLEAKTSLEWINLPEVKGYADVMISSEGRLDIIDWKFGQGVPVVVENNTQLKAYAAGSFIDKRSMCKTEDIYIHVVQPRLDYFKSYKLTGEELYTWIVEELKPAIFNSRLANAPCIPGEKQCRWCVGVNCKVRTKKVQKTMRISINKYLDKVNTTDFVDDSEIAYLLKELKFVDQYIKDLSKIALAKCISGKGFPGYKAVAGRSIRRWKDEKKAEEWLTKQADKDTFDFEYEDLYTAKFISIAKAEKLTKELKKDKMFKDLWIKPLGKPVLVPEDDPREPFNADAAEVFKDYVKK